MPNRIVAWPCVQLLVLALWAQASGAEAVFDGSVGPNADGTTISGDMIIKEADGATRGSNLFHSFRLFDIDEGESATFTTTSPVENIIARVTGDAVQGNTGSTLAGPLRADSGVQLHLLNPMGILFAPGAQIDISGSVVLTTADALRIDGPGGPVSFRVQDATPMLSSGSPSAYVFDPGSSGRIDFRGDAQAAGSTFFELGPDADVTLIASDVGLSAAILRSESGMIRVAATGSDGADVPIDVAGWSPGATAGEVAMSDFSILCMDSSLCFQDGSATLADRGRIVIRGGRFSLGDSRLVAGGDGSAPFAIDIETSAEIEATGPLSLVEVFGTGPNVVGGIRWTSPLIDVRDVTVGFTITSNRSAGPLRLEADEIRIEGSTLETISVGDGDGANIELIAPNVTITDGTLIRTTSRSSATGDAGSVVVDAGNTGTVDLSGLSLLVASTNGSGGAGRIVEAGTPDERRLGVSIRSGDLNLSGGFQVSSTTEAAGDAGNVEIALGGDLSISGRVVQNGDTFTSGLFARSGLNSDSTASGDGGLISVSARSMSVRDGAEVSALSFGTGNAGSVNIDLTGDLVVDGTNTSINARGFGDGNGGDLTFSASNVTVANGAEIAAEAQLGGDAGAIDVSAREVLDVDASSILARLRGVGADGEGGDIRLGAGSSLLIRRGALVSSEGASTRDAGSVALQSLGEVRIESGSLVSTAASNLGNAGSIDVAAGRFSIEDAAMTTVSDISAGGRISVSTSESLILQSSRLETSVELSGDGSGGDVSLVGNVVVVDESQVIADARNGPGGNILLSGQGVLVSGDSVLRASSDTNVDGETELRAPDVNLIDRLSTLPATMLVSSSELASRCAARDPSAQSSFVVGERDATPPSPSRWLEPVVPGTRWGGATIGRLPANVEAALRRGDYSTAAEMLDVALEQEGAATKRVELALAAASVYDALGASHEAERRRATAFTQAQGLEDEALMLRVQADLAAAPAVAAPSLAEIGVLERAAAQPALSPVEAARIQAQLGLALARAGQPEAARRAFERSAEAARAGDAPLTKARALAREARIAVEQGDAGGASDAVRRASDVIAEAPSSSMLAETRIHLGETLRELGADDPMHRSAAYTQLVAAKNEAEAARDARTAAAAWGGLALLYEDEGRVVEALGLAREAARLAKQAEASELLYGFEWQMARLLAASGDRTGALAAFERALDELGGLRFEAPPPGRDYRSDVAAVYYGLVDLLLQAPDANDAELETRLRRVRSTIEASKASELRDYFQDPCVDALVARTRSIDEISEGALVVYPIPLEDRLELLVTRPGGGLSLITVPVDAATLEGEIRRFRRLVTKRATRQYLSPARTLYDHLIRPLEPLLGDADIETLVFVPDGSLRTIPMGALHDGEAFLIERFAVAVTPSIALTDPRAIPGEDIRALLGGISAGRDGFAPLLHVPRELGALHAEFGGDLLIDDAFNTPALEALVETHDYNLVHLATHAEFGDDGEESFLLTADGRLTVDRLEALIGRFRYREEPLELLGLSACETGAGDDRAALGLSGIAVRAGARSVLGTLWSVNDEASADLVTRFYAELPRAGVSRAEALRRAQLEILGRKELGHPYYWAPFILINSWL